MEYTVTLVTDQHAGVPAVGHVVGAGQQQWLQAPGTLPSTRQQWSGTPNRTRTRQHPTPAKVSEVTSIYFYGQMSRIALAAAASESVPFAY